MISAAVSRNPGKYFTLEPLLFAQDGIASSPRFERACLLQVLALKEQPEAAIQ